MCSSYMVFVTDFPVIDFIKIYSFLRGLIKCLWDICQAVLTNNCLQESGNRNPEKTSHARWFTMAYRIVRLYTAILTLTLQLKAVD